MRSILTAIIAAIESVAVALAGGLLVATFAMVLWGAGFGFAADPGDVGGAVAGGWLLAHFVPLHFSVSAQAALGLGLPAQALQIPVSLAPLGLTALTVVLAARSGWRFSARGGVGFAAVLGGSIGFGAAAAVAAAFAGPVLDAPRWVAIALPAAVYAISSGVPFLVRAATEPHDWWLAAARGLGRVREYLGVRSLPSFGWAIGAAIRIATASTVALLGLGAFGVAVGLIAGYVDSISLSQQLQLDPLGAILLFVLQLALLPVAVIWGATWWTGTGFAIGQGSSVSPFGTYLGPLPQLPLLGALPPEWAAIGAAAPAVVLVLGLVIGLLAAPRLAGRARGLAATTAVPVLGGILAGGAVALLSLLASGAAGPDRLSVTGPDAWAAGGFAALELGIGLLLGVLIGRREVLMRAVGELRVPDLSALPIPGRSSRAGAVADGTAEGAVAQDPSPADASGSGTTGADAAGPLDLPLPEIDAHELAASEAAIAAGSFADQETAPIDPLEADEPLEPRDPPATHPDSGTDRDAEEEAPATDTVAADQATVEISEEAVAAAQEQPETDAAPEPAEPADARDEDADEHVDPLLRAFSWDAGSPDGGSVPDAIEPGPEKGPRAPFQLPKGLRSRLRRDSVEDDDASPHHGDADGVR
ncbi:hypothetical protein BMH31_13755 [Leucobacter sp. OLIS6]|uniref:cell division protein PerM n=1 Tax=unclassified Leucobacter TaxID=2621730 RepID=UPI000C18E9B5|nr:MULTISPECIES: DUF6350 family protein [unclassified Leucobacter]PII83397.1 hypothetical protein BMH25_08280 [Leucobacter sp. OLCALW19]PII86947.1 hypothetical protein BMH26_11655 [Leucobacter sp. OLTLW20]PII89213.1 hypothetical protein BMH27_14700 [Leucobacter sp. OLAS13]PII99423.1 hypothetical protein BMH29_04915 [Leucobacter sp. OLDS2]PII99937.1 hypothetical protein BMH28_10225 [Leucobacter sp. OLCS4]